ncbi:PIN domain-containing protein [Catellatospora aurea]|uniref:PIN domain-containing protein n=1 Tax=Catellatospora aurea TaxID=1337874 RepID=A0ABW2H8C2_9ACTN
MLVTPTRNVDRLRLRKEFDLLEIAVSNLRGTPGPGHLRLTAYLQWVATTARQLRPIIRTDDIDRLLFTQHYKALLELAGTKVPLTEQGIVNDLLALELDALETSIRNAADAVARLIERWLDPAVFIACDANFFLHHGRELGFINFHDMIKEAGGYTDLVGNQNRVNLLVPSRVIYELDKGKTHSNKEVRKKARRALITIDDWFEDPQKVHWEEPRKTTSPWPDVFSAELLLDPIGHLPMPSPDDEIIDRILAVEPFAARRVTLITYDTNMATRARATGLKVIKLKHLPEDAA